MRRLADHPAALAVLALVVAAVGARPYPGGWNDASRLATVESLVDRGTLAIDDSVFLARTQDKLLVRGHFYSDKPAVVSLLLAGAVKPLTWLGLPAPGERPDVFAWVVTVLLSGVGYAAAVGCLAALGRRIGLTPGVRLLWLAAFALATFAPTYTRHANAHAAQLGVAAAMCLLMLRTATAGDTPWGTLVGLGTLAGVGFNLDFGTGPPLVALTLAAVAWRFRRVGPVAAFALAVLPWVAAGVGVNYAVSGKPLPMNMYREFFDFPGSPFTEANLTGYSRHGPLSQALYAGGMLVGKHGYWNHNLPLLLAAVGTWGVLRRAFPGRAELVALLGWCVGAWAAYAVLSNNMGGQCCSVRWFVPFLAPGFWLLAEILKQRPQLVPDFAALSGWGAVLAAVMWANGPWIDRMVPGMWFIAGAALLTWGAVAARRWRRLAAVTEATEVRRRAA
ncbi:hypothetical protein [Urbifossiella limnaea]|uniref:Glycosyltransferase RgtA/B/C/D-like domain-containing protein n=1 Tax=Urbifossiella limnaea TaxID=2528023 RepID=A0A517Y0Z9_9BACT|nr:hypothetical protein [Urbifossiella limnaea]QDU23442.1 hypothetical protein ETAA1_54420 [Urbifossiella limnaea]